MKIVKVSFSLYWHLSLSFSFPFIFGSVPFYLPVIWSFSLNYCVPLIFLLFAFISTCLLAFHFNLHTKAVFGGECLDLRPTNRGADKVSVVVLRGGGLVD